MRFRVIGSVGVDDDEGRPLALGGAQQRRLLAVLLAAPGRQGSNDALVDALWPREDLDGRHATTLRSYVFRLRACLGDSTVLTTDVGYRLVLDGHGCDADDLVGAVRVSFDRTDPAERVAALDRALRSWVGRAYGEFADEPWCRSEVARLEELHLVALEHRADALLALGRASEAVADLEAHVAEHPLREHFVALLVRALDESGRQADALRRLHEHRRWLRDETGLEPGTELRELERHVLSGDIASNRSGGDGRVRGYELGEVIGQGSFGTVHRAVQEAVGREVAVKVIRGELADDPSFIKRFEAEAQLVAGLEHPHIVPVYDYWREPGGAFLVFRLMRGGNAEERLIANGPFRLEDVSAIVEQVGSALAVAHSAGVVHRDVKPANIVFDERGDAFLTDFGIALGPGPAGSANAMGSDLPSAGSPLYAAPEQLQTGFASARTDLYSFALVVYELLSGRNPFAAIELPTMLQAKMSSQLPLLHPVCPDVPSSFDALLRTATATDPEDRFETVSDMIVAWRAAIASGPTQRTGPQLVTSSPAETLTSVAMRLEHPNPYKGLRAFSEADSVDFFGRERLAEQLVADVAAARFVAVVGASGSGKSSLVRAGLLALTRADGRFVASMTPGTHPFDELEIALLRIAVNPPPSLLSQLAEPRGLARAVRRVLPDADGVELLLVIDQFEELYTLTLDVAERQRFLDGLVELVGDDTVRVRILVTLRADFYDRPLQDHALGELVRNHTFALTPLSTEELATVVVGPAHRVGVTVEPTLVSHIVAEVGAQPGSLPLLQFALTELYERRQGAVLTSTGYLAIGGVSGALTAKAEELFASCDPDERSAVRNLFTRLVSLGDGVADTRRRALRSELTSVPDRVIDMFGRHRILTFDHEPSTRQPTVEVAHEALITAWPRLRSWLDEDRGALRSLRHLSDATRIWDRGGRDADELYRGARLSGVVELVGSNPHVLSQLEHEFVSASREVSDAHANRQARTMRRVRRLLVATAAGLVLAVAAGGIAIVQRARADHNALAAHRNAVLADDNARQADQNARAAAARAAEAASEAKRARNSESAATQLRDSATVRALVTDSNAAQSRDLPVALLLAREASNRADNPATQGALLSALVSNDPVVGFWWTTASYSSLALSGDGLVLVGGRNDGMVEVRRTSDGSMIGEPWKVSPPQLNGVGFDSMRLVLSSDARRLVVATPDGTVALWDLGEHTLLHTLSVVPTAAGDAPFFSDIVDHGGVVLVSQNDGSVRTFDDRDGTQRGIVATVPGTPSLLALDDTGDELVVSYATTAGQLFYDSIALSTATVARHSLDLGGANIGSIALSPDGATLAAASVSGSPQLFDVATGTRRGHATTNLVDPRLVFLSNQQLVAVRVVMVTIDVASGDEASGPWPISRTAGSIAADPTHQRLFVGDQTAGEIVRVDFHGDRKLGRSLGLVGTAATSNASGDKLVVGTPDGGAIVIDATSGRALSPPMRTDHTNLSPFHVTPIIPSFSPDGTEIALGTLAGTMDIYSAATGALLRSLPVPPDTPNPTLGPVFGTQASSVTGSGRWSPDGTMIATGFWTTVTVLDAHTGQLRSRLGDFDQVITGIGFSPDSQRILASSYNGRAALFDAHTGKVLADHLTCGAVGAGQSSWVGADAVLGALGVGNGDTEHACLIDDTGHPTGMQLDTTAFAAPQVTPDHRLYVGLDLLTGRTSIQDLSTGTVLGTMPGLGLLTASGHSLVTVDHELADVVSWSLDPGAWRSAACNVAGRNLTQTEWQRYLPSEPYQLTCPQFPTG